MLTHYQPSKAPYAGAILSESSFQINEQKHLKL